MTDILESKLNDPDWRDGQTSTLEVGQWLWLTDKGKPWLGCIIELGSNYAKISAVDGGTCRVHFDEFDKECVPEPNWRQIISEHADSCRQHIASCLERVKQLTHDLGVSPREAIAGPSESSNALAVIHRAEDAVGKYKTDLVLAKDKTLPALQEEIKKASTQLAHWLSAEALPMQGNLTILKDSMERVKTRIFTIELYAGLVEELVKIKDGAPGAITDKLHVMQRRCYMDEECIAGYDKGGIDCTNIKDFDKWLSRKNNFERLLPFPRTIVAFRVRREACERQWDGTISGAIWNFRLGEWDKQTFLYIRNGQQLYRLNTTMDFGTKLFPDREEMVMSDGVWGKVYCGEVQYDSIIGQSEYQDMLDREKKLRQKRKEWLASHPKKEHWHCPYDDYFKESRDYYPFDRSSVYYDDIAKALGKQINDYNHIAVIIQGLYDRSLSLHPHPPVKLWSPEGFAAAVELVYESMTLHHGEAPDFEAYRLRCNASLDAGSVTYGQDIFWQRREAEKENARQRRDWRCTRVHEYDVYQPYGDPGPGDLALVAHWRSRKRVAVYEWRRDRRRSRWGNNEPVVSSVAVPDTMLFNVDAYEPGDFRKFYSDYRTRMQYLKWAPTLLTAEAYRTGAITIDGKVKRKCSVS